MTDRTPRTTEIREKIVRKKGWSRPSALPTPEPRDGLHFRWIRTSTLGNSDNTNVLARFREGYISVKVLDVPELTVVFDIDFRFKDNVEVGGLLLCSIPAEIAEERVEVQLEQAQHAQDAVDRNFMRENDPRMPVLNPERSTRTSFGK
jgi:hypothetical protein